ncbi:hypothetical protein JIN84_07820 [Luteolibacter yonseiensis]|uniref:Uncharacterized protein n=1 Tax=Luteolibacter yonseiensis TaxID=1144680 RepID=A0A934R2B9_9BACT|nr:hypothetical protein [Luteolibacter yonseiensis]MBK1815517.1 hypothetical protein [Luteolibacter yonseiensis]
MKPNPFQIFALSALATGQIHAAVVTLKATGDAANTTSFNAGTNWSDATAPSALNTYVVANLNTGVFLRTPTDGASYTFQGASLEIGTAGGMIYKGTAATNTYTISNLILSGGLVRSGAGSTNTMILAGGITVNGTGSTIQTDQSPYTIDSIVTGTGALTTTGGYTLTFNGANTYTGSMTVSTAGNLGTALGTNLSSTSHWKFVVGTNGVSNKITGTGKLSLNGTFDIDVAGASTSVGNSWTLVAASTLAETYTSTFNLANFTSDGGAVGARVWTKPINSTTFYRYSEATGVLSVFQSDTDGDGLSDLWEDQYFGNNDGTATTAELELQTGSGDPDGDGASNVDEQTAGTNPNSASSWPDTDADGLKDSWEIGFFQNITAQNGAGDADGDLVTNLQEFLADTSPTDPTYWPDTDFDDMNDGWERTFFAGSLSHDGTADSDGDLYTDRQEHDAHTNPSDPTSTPISSKLKNRWSFNGNLNDSVGGSPATIVEVGANDVAYNDVTTPTGITMTGGVRTAADYVKLGSNLLPKGITPVTIELWARQNAIQNWGRIFDFHSGTTEYLMMAWTRAAADASDQVEIVDTGVVSNSPDKIQPYGITTEHHIVMTLEPLAGDSGRMRVRVYSAPSGAADLGGAKVSFNTAANLVNLNDVVNALGYSPWPGDATASATYNEVRIWNGSLVPAVREQLHDQGPDNATIADSDNDFLSDAWEITHFGNLTAANSLGDNDGDTINNRTEYLAGSNPNNAISTPDDTDADGLEDSWEITYFGNVAAQNGTGDPDGDGYNNETEETEGTDPTVSEDTDGDGLVDTWEISFFGNITAQDGSGDPDNDTFNNEAEETAKSNPTVTLSIPDDVDGDGLSDTWEIKYFTNLTAQNGGGDPDADTFSNEAEETAGSNPTVATSVPGDTNGDGLPDGFLFVTPDPLGTSSFNSGTGWSNAAAPAAGNNYLVAIQNLRTPGDAEPYTFAGDNLVLTTGGTLVVKGTGVVTIPHFGLDGGTVNNATGTNVAITLAGEFRITRLSELWANNNSIIVNAVVTGNKDLNITRSGTANTVTFNAVNPFTGNLNVTGGFVLGSTGSLAFKPGASTVTNAVLGVGTAVFDGAFNIDLGSAGTAVGDHWSLVSAATLTETYSATFHVTGFTADAAAPGTRKWTSGNYRFDEATGVLTRIEATGDTDSDGMADTWESTWFGGLGQTATGDFDGDGTNNLTEYRLGLVPNSGTSRFAVTRAANGTLTWPSAVGVTFVVQRSQTLAAGSWVDVRTVPGTAGTANFSDDSPLSGNAFYRVLLQP